MDDEKKTARVFFKKNISLFAGTTFNKSEYDSKKEDFLMRNFGHLDERILAKLVIETYIEAGRFKTIEELASFLVNNDFFRKTIYADERSRYSEFWTDLSTKGFPKEFNKHNILTILSLEEARENAEAQEIQIRSTKIDQLDKDIEKKKEEYAAIPSIIDIEPQLSEPIDEPVYQDFTPWWEKLGLIQDPFVVTDGLSKIPKDLYRKIIVKTDIINKYTAKLNQDPESIFSKSTIFFGEFGSGKTTLFEFLANEMINHKIYPFYLLLKTEPDTFTLRRSFEKKILEAVYEEYKKETADHTEPDFHQGVFDKTKELMKYLSHDGERGFIIFVDGLNQGENYTVLLPFLRDLQAYKNELVRSNLKAGFFIAGSNEWSNLITKDPSLTGAIEVREQMPIVDINQAHTMINSRFSAFSKNQQNPKKVKETFIKQVYRDLENNKLKISYRSFIQALIERFKQGNFEMIENIQISDPILDKIRKEFESNQILKKRMDQLIYSGQIQKEENRNLCLKLLIKIFIEGQIKDDSEIVRDNIYHFQRLDNSKLIVKFNKEEGTFWAVCPELREQNSKIFDTFHRSIDDYLLRLYSKLTQKKQNIVEDENIIKIKELISVLETEKNGQISNLIRDSVPAYKSILGKLANVYEEITPESLTGCWNSFGYLSSAFFLTQGVISNELIREEGTEILWENYWTQKESISEYIKRHKSSPITETDRRIVCDRYKDAYNTIISEIEFHIRQWGPFPRNLSHISPDELELLFSVYTSDSWRKEEYTHGMSKLSTYLQRKFRDFLYNIFTLLYGCDKNKWLNERIEDSVKNLIIQNISKSRCSPFTPSDNIFNQLNRGNYKKFLTEDNIWSNRNWGEIFQFVFKGWTRKDFDDFLGIYFAPSLIEGEHDKESKIDKEYAFNYFKKWIYVIQSLNTGYFNLLTNNLYQDGEAYYFSFKGYRTKDNETHLEHGVQDKKSLTPISPSDEIFKRDINHFNHRINIDLIETNHRKINVDLEDGNEQYGISYRAYVFYFSLLLQKSKFKLEGTNATEAYKKSGVLFQERGDKFLLDFWLLASKECV